MYVGETDTYLLVTAEDYKITVTYADRTYGPTEEVFYKAKNFRIM